ncbi:hypothetical protein VF12_17985, partial [Nostoc linckia z15]
MGANLKQIAKYLDNLGWDYRFDDEEDRIITGVEAEEEKNFLNDLYQALGVSSEMAIQIIQVILIKN